MMTDDEIIAVVQAHKQRKKIMVVLRGSSSTGTLCDTPNWNFKDFDYYVVPEPRKPREWWINPNAYDHQAYEHPDALGKKLIHVREVIE